MNACRYRFFFRLGIAPVCAFSASVLLPLVFSFDSTLAQELKPVADGTLGAESSLVTPISPQVDRIDGGAIRGVNLFHSFSQFNIGEGREAYFANPSGIENILSRVTGSDASRIFGKLGVLGNANLFLINPNGIIFGRNASLDVRGSFVGTTANAIGFGDRGFWGATVPNSPELLTINPSALFFNQITAARIENNSVATAGRDPAGLNAFGLRVDDGKSLVLIGGNVSMDGGKLNANGGRVELGGLGEPGSVGLGVDGNNLRLIFPQNVARADISLTNQAAIYVEGTGSGDIAVNARNLEVLGGSVLSAGIGRGLGTPETVAGDITLNATGEIKVADTGSIVNNSVRLRSLGNGGNITINSGFFSLRDGARLEASTFGQGNAGNVTVRATDAVSLADAYILSTVEAGGVGNGGNITIDSDSFALRDGAGLSVSTLGRGNAGNVTVRALDAVSLVDAYIFSTVEAGGVGKGGNIDINASTLSLIDGAQLLTATQPVGRGDAGNVNVKVTGAVSLSGKKNDFVSGIGSFVGTGTVGNGGNITINSGSFSLRDGARLEASTFGQGNAGNVTVRAKDSVSLANNAVILSTVEVGGVGKGGNIDINAATLSLIGAGLEASTFGQGNAGNVTVRAKDSVSLANNAAILSTVGAGGVGKGGNIDINAAT